MNKISKIIILLVFGIVFVSPVSFSGDHVARETSTDIDNDGRKETVQWRKFVGSDFRSYYQLRVIDDDIDDRGKLTGNRTSL